MQLLQAKPRRPVLPLAIVSYGEPHPATDTLLNLDFLKEEGLISHHSVITIQQDLEHPTASRTV